MEEQNKKMITQQKLKITEFLKDYKKPLFFNNQNTIKNFNPYLILEYLSSFDDDLRFKKLQLLFINQLENFNKQTLSFIELVKLNWFKNSYAIKRLNNNLRGF